MEDNDGWIFFLVFTPHPKYLMAFVATEYLNIVLCINIHIIMEISVLLHLSLDFNYKVTWNFQMQIETCEGYNNMC